MGCKFLCEHDIMGVPWEILGGDLGELGTMSHSFCTLRRCAEANLGNDTWHLLGAVRWPTKALKIVVREVEGDGC
jgi:hypothetical protein